MKTSDVSKTGRAERKFSISHLAVSNLIVIQPTTSVVGLLKAINQIVITMQLGFFECRVYDLSFPEILIQ